MNRQLARAFDAGRGLVVLREHPSLRSTIGRLAGRGDLVRVMPGVYARPGPIDDRVRLRAACLWCPRGVLHAQTAVGMWLGSEPSPIRLATAVRRVPPVGVVTTIRAIPGQFVVHQGGLRLATPAFALVETAHLDEGRAIMDALRLRLVRTADLREPLAALAGTRFQESRATVVRAAERNPWSYAEGRLQQVLLRAGIDGWLANRALVVGARTYWADILFEAQRLVLEFDGFEVHSQAHQFVIDRERQNALVNAGYRVLRFVWEHITERPDYVVATVRAALRATRLDGWA